MEIIGYISAILIGISLGLVGSGGSILTVPVLVYLMSVDPLLATTSSLFIVGFTSLIGGIRAYTKKQLDYRAVTEFGFPSVLSIFITRHNLLPAIPDIIFTTGGITVTKNMLLMLIFAVLMLLASWSMIRSRDSIKLVKAKEGGARVFPLMIFGLLIGVVTGLLGAGGGFLIIPTLVLFLGLDMKTAVGTSLLIIAINSLFGFLFSLNHFSFNWILLLSFTALSAAGLFIGSHFSDKISPATLKKGFGWFILFMGIFVIVRELFFA
jgi:uncharacterized protein